MAYSIMLQGCVHSGSISCIYRQGSMDFVELPGIMHGVMGPLLQYYYMQCYLSYKINHEIVLNVFL